MSGRWLLEATALFGASRIVVSKHIALRNHQFDKYSQTSSLAKAIKSHAGRVTLIVRAATAITERFNEAGPEYPSPSHVQQTSTATKHVPSNDSVGGSQVVSLQTEGLQQVHHYKRSDGNQTQHPLLHSSLDIQQEKSTENTLHDGTIPSRKSDPVTLIKEHKITSETQQAELNKGNTSESPGRGTPLSATEAQMLQLQSEAQIPLQPVEPLSVKFVEADAKAPAKPELGVDQEKDEYYTFSSRSSPVLSSLPNVKVPKVTEDVQGSDEHVPDIEMNQDVYYSPKARGTGGSVPESQTILEQESVRGGMCSEIFYSPRAAKLLGGGPKGDRKPHAMDLKMAGSIANPDRKVAEERDSDTFISRPNIQGSTPSKYQEPAATPELPTRESEADISQLAADIAEDTQTGPGAEGEVGIASETSRVWYWSTDRTLTGPGRHSISGGKIAVPDARVSSSFISFWQTLAIRRISDFNGFRSP